MMIAGVWIVETVHGLAALDRSHPAHVLVMPAQANQIGPLGPIRRIEMLTAIGVIEAIHILRRDGHHHCGGHLAARGLEVAVHGERAGLAVLLELRGVPRDLLGGLLAVAPRHPHGGREFRRHANARVHSDDRCGVLETQHLHSHAHRALVALHRAGDGESAGSLVLARIDLAPVDDFLAAPAVIPLDAHTLRQVRRLTGISGHVLRRRHRYNRSKYLDGGAGAAAVERSFDFRGTIRLSLHRVVLAGIARNRRDRR